MIVRYSTKFNAGLDRLNDDLFNEILKFENHIIEHGFTGLPGRNKSSADTENEEEKSYAAENHLWHYHIGYPAYDKRFGFTRYTSKYIIHYQRYPDRIILVDVTEHPPFILPSPNKL